MRKLVTIQKISDIQPIEGADTIEKAKVKEWWVVIKKGEDTRGFGLSIRNIDEEATFSYEITAQEVSCSMQLTEAEKLISLNRERNNIVIPAGSIMENPIFVKFNIPDNTAPCQIVYSINILKGTEAYGASTDVYVTVKSE